jgi:hypothetical protein
LRTGVIGFPQGSHLIVGMGLALQPSRYTPVTRVKA